MNQALIVIDVQESFRHRPYFRAQELPGFLRNVQSLIDRCQARGSRRAGVPPELPDDAGNPFSAASGLRARDAGAVAAAGGAVFYKQVHSAMFGRTTDGTTLEEWLRQRGIGELLITGIRTEQCCETTTRHASDLGFSVRYVTDATLTFPMRTRCGPRSVAGGNPGAHRDGARRPLRADRLDRSRARLKRRGACRARRSLRAALLGDQELDELDELIVARERVALHAVLAVHDDGRGRVHLHGEDLRVGGAHLAVDAEGVAPWRGTAAAEPATRA